MLSSLPHHRQPFPLLLVKGPQRATREVGISRTPFTIGRKPDNDLCLDDTAVSGCHARIVQVQNVLILEDLDSANGISVNEQKVDRRHLQDADSIRIGTHRLIFLDDRTDGTEETASRDMSTIAQPPFTEGFARGEQAPASPAGVIEILSGRTAQPHYRLTQPNSLIGAQDDAVIILTGWFAPKAAATISRRSDGYLVSPTESGRRILLNGRLVPHEHPLSHGDVLEVAGVTMRFLLPSPTKDRLYD